MNFASVFAGLPNNMGILLWSFIGKRSIIFLIITPQSNPYIISKIYRNHYENIKHKNDAADMVCIIPNTIFFTEDNYAGLTAGVIRERNSESWSLANARRYFRNEDVISRVS